MRRFAYHISPAMDIETLIAAGKYGEAAAEARRLGDLARAQQLYERIWDWKSAADAARAHLALGRILAGFGRHDEAVRHLQKAIAKSESFVPTPATDATPATVPPLDAATLLRARRLVIVELAALGYRDAARALLEPMRAVDPRLPPLDAFVVAERR